MNGCKCGVKTPLFQSRGVPLGMLCGSEPHLLHV